MPRPAAPRPPAKLRASDALRSFVDSWGALGDLFGFSPSTARVSALLLVSPRPLSLGEIAESLGISRGNASMCLKDLRTWGVVRLAPQSGDRRDFYQPEGDLWSMFLTIARERKRREFEPSMRGALAALTALGTAGATPAPRADAIRDFLETLDRIGRGLLDNDAAGGRALIELLRQGRVPGPR